MYYSQLATKKIDQFANEDIANWEEILNEDFKTLSELQPADLARYKNLFWDFCPKQNYHVKRAYTSGFKARKAKLKKDGSYYLPSAYPDLLEKHLDLHRWNKIKEVNPADQDKQFILALRFGHKTTLSVIDFDNKHNLLGYYHCCPAKSDTARPLPLIDLKHAQNIKAIYNSFPDRIWCVSSGTLGLHIWRKHELQTNNDVERKHRYLLKQIGLGNTEVYPTPATRNQCFRRPFGQDYYTICDNGLLSDWVEQLNHFENQAETPALTTILNCMWQLAAREIIRYEQCNGLMINKGDVLNNWVAPDHLKQYEACPDFVDVNAVKRELAIVKHWIDAGCPDEHLFQGMPAHAGTQTAELSDVYLMSDDRDSVIKISTDQDEPETDKSLLPTYCLSKCMVKETKSVDFDTDSINRNTGLWCQSCLDFAKNGLPKDDSLFDVVSALTRWFYFIEFFDTEKIERQNRITDLLQKYILTKHNGFCSTLNNGDEDTVLKRVSYVVQHSIKTSTEQDIFLRIRLKRKQGKYQTTYMLEPLINNQAETDKSLLPTYCLSKCMVKETKSVDICDNLLPNSIENRLLQIAKENKMRRKNGEYPFIKFSRRLLNMIYQGNGKQRINHQTINLLMGKKPNAKDRVQPLKYKKLLAQHKLIFGDWENYIKRGQHSSLYRMQKPVLKLFMMHYEEKQQIA